MWGEEDDRSNLGLEKFGVDIGAINETPTVHERIFRYWLKDWEKPLITSNRAALKLRFLQNYKGLVFTDININETFKISCEK